MARKVEVRLVDDLDGSRADETVVFGLDGFTFEIDLSAKHAKELRSSLDRYLLNARQVRRDRLAPARTRQQPARAAVPTRLDGLQSQAIRQWAQRKGLIVSTRGRIPQSVIDRYQAEAGRTQPPAASAAVTTAPATTGRRAAAKPAGRLTTTRVAGTKATRAGKAAVGTKTTGARATGAKATATKATTTKATGTKATGAKTARAGAKRGKA